MTSYGMTNGRKYREVFSDSDKAQMIRWQSDWPAYARENFGVFLDPEQEAILRSVQHNRRTSVASGTARGKDFIAAVACMCFLHLTPRFSDGKLTSTKVFMTAPTDRQVKNIMVPEISRLHQRSKAKLPGGRLTGYDIRTNYPEWFLTGFKADHYNTESWTGLHATNIMFVVTEASGMPELVYDALEGNLQGNSRILIVFNPNSSVGYAARSQSDPRWNRFQLSSLTAPNVIAKKTLIPGQVDYDWVKDKVNVWAQPIRTDEIRVEEDDFEFEGQWYRPEDRFRIKVLGKFPKVPEYILIPPQWYDLAVERWKTFYAQEHPVLSSDLVVGLDVAGMGRDSSVFTYRHDNIVSKIYGFNSGGTPDHTRLAGIAAHDLRGFPQSRYKIDTIGEGAGIFPMLTDQGFNQGRQRVYSAKFSESAVAASGLPLTDITGEYRFANMRAYCYWALRDWLNPVNNTGAALPENDHLRVGLSQIRWAFNNQGKIQLEPKLDIIERIGRSPDEEDSLALTFYPEVHNVKLTEADFDKSSLGFF